MYRNASTQIELFRRYLSPFFTEILKIMNLNTIIEDKGKTIYDIIEETFYKQELYEWNYYSGKVFKTNPMLSRDKSKEFIKNFIKLSEKSGNRLNEEIDKIGDRATHIVSTFFIGYYIYKNTIFESLINNEIELKKQKWKVNSDVNFSFIWFLTCLFHDLGYAIESSKKIEYISLCNLEKGTRKLGEVDGVPKFYEDISANYYRYRIEQYGTNDHGITAAYLLYDSLCQIRSLAENSNPYNGEKLCWEKELEKVYNFCAWNILAHNIWFCNKSDEKRVEMYEKYGLNDLILENGNYKIKLEEHPFFFFLCLVDTIEPYKRVKSYKELKDIKLEIIDKNTINIISLSDKNDLSDAIGLEKWLAPVIKKEAIIEIK